MNQDNAPSMTSVLLTFAVGAAVGAVVVALTTPKTGAGLRRDLKRLTRCGDGASEQAKKDRTNAGIRHSQVPGDQRRAWKVSTNDQPG